MKTKIDNAIILAAGWGSRLMPATKNLPKPLVEVNGTSIIETQIKALISKSITEIVIVVGRFHEKFDELVEKYNLIKIVNDEWDKANAFVTLAKAVDHFKNTIILEGDTIISNPDVINAEISQSTIAGVNFEKEQNEYVLTFKEDKVTGYTSPENISKGTYIVNIYHLLEKDSLIYKENLQKHINNEEYRQGYAERALFESNADIFLQKINPSDAIEIDTYNELKELDSSYK